MSNLLEKAIGCSDGEQAATILQHALGIESDDVVNYCFPKEWPNDRELRAKIIGEWLSADAKAHAACNRRDGKQDSTDHLGDYGAWRDLSCRPPAGSGCITITIHE